MKKTLLLVALAAVTAVPLVALQPAAADDPWLGRLVGHWVLKGQIAGKDTAHDVDAEWVLNHLYVRLHEVSREKNPDGRAAYEALVYVTRDPVTGEYSCLWLDTTASGGFAAEGVGRAKPDGDSLPFVFKDARGDVSFRNTFVYDAKRSAWAWTMDNVDHGASKPFGRVLLTRR